MGAPAKGVSGTSGREGSGVRLSHPGIDEIVINGEKIKTSVSVSTSVATSVQKVRKREGTKRPGQIKMTDWSKKKILRKKPGKKEKEKFIPTRKRDQLRRMTGSVIKPKVGTRTFPVTKLSVNEEKDTTKDAKEEIGSIKKESSTEKIENITDEKLLPKEGPKKKRRKLKS